MAVGEFFFTPLVLYIIPKYCHDEFFVDLNFFHVVCLKIALSKLLGYFIVALASIAKLPQIIKVLRASSVEGLSLLSFITELTTMTGTFSYSSARGFPFSTWGESLFKAIQTCFLVMLFFYYSSRPLAAVLFPFLYGAIVYVVLSGLTPIAVLVQLVSLNILFLSISRVSQIATNFRNGHTGQLSFVMVVMLLFNHAARIFTTLQETGDKYMLVTFIISTIFNVTMVTQILYYWNVNIDEQKKRA
ncbi:mannose-P-dolichol utilization defect 1 protein-like isoform X1 [Orbicella faveolata]|uniref:mannose-P-dolichol utilization defect 1 protein-like isoform X1 n=1 Tax=Orbicella faveolata TaxID=48498 RepID=UPI0009E325B8|nr:mannose-P-dolichol utilization defect 1 protein-like isoform X1 [Orbicella faveolata]